MASETDNPVADLMPIEKAAKLVRYTGSPRGLDKARARHLAIKYGIAVRWGGSDAHPWLRVSVAALKAAVLREEYRLPKGQKKPAPKGQNKGPKESVTQPKTLHRFVEC